MGLTWRVVIAAVALVAIGWALGTLGSATSPARDVALGILAAGAATLLYAARSWRR